MKHVLTSTTQTRIAAKLGVDQPYICRVLKGQFRRRVGHYDKILTYLDMQILVTPEPETLALALKRYARRGGDEGALGRMIDLFGEVQSGKRS